MNEFLDYLKRLDSRADHIGRSIKEALEGKEIVIVDRKERE
jgi:thymidylate kinase